jgi:hypothetical protein
LANWTLDGHELSDDVLNALGQIPGFRTLYTGEISTISARYNLASLIHVLEHLPSPIAAMGEIAGLLHPGGRILIEVPNLAASPFDLVVADHLTHFTKDTLHHAADRAGIAIDVISDEILAKELSLLGGNGATRTVPKPGDSSASGAVPKPGEALAENAVTWLTSLLETANDASGAAVFGLFGSSIASQWLYGALGGALESRVKFFVDEDVDRIGRKIDGIPIIAPAQVPGDATVFAPLLAGAIENLAPRLEKSPGSYLYPPPWPRAKQI